MIATSEDIRTTREPTYRLWVERYPAGRPTDVLEARKGTLRLITPTSRPWYRRPVVALDALVGLPLTTALLGLGIILPASPLRYWSPVALMALLLQAVALSFVAAGEGRGRWPSEATIRDAERVIDLQVLEVRSGRLGGGHEIRAMAEGEELRLFVDLRQASAQDLEEALKLAGKQ